MPFFFIFIVFKNAIIKPQIVDISAISYKIQLLKNTMIL